MFKKLSLIIVFSIILIFTIYSYSSAAGCAAGDSTCSGCSSNEACGDVNKECMPVRCVGQKVVYECHDPNDPIQVGSNSITYSQYKYMSTEIGDCINTGSQDADQDRTDRIARQEAGEDVGGKKEGSVCKVKSDCSNEQYCTVTSCDWAKKQPIYTCTVSSEPLLSADDIAKCKAGTLEQQLKLEGECAAKAPTERGIFTKGLSDFCVGCGICSQKDVFQEFINIFTFILQISGSLAVLILVVGGLMYMTAAGDQQKTGQAKAALTAAIVGIIIVLTSFLLISFVMSLLGYTNAGSWFSPTLK